MSPEGPPQKAKGASNTSIESRAKREKFDINAIKTWEEEEGGVCVKNIEAVPTALWREGWYRNPSSGRSNNFGINTEKPQKHSTVIVKGGCFFTDEETKEAFRAHSLSVKELFGGVPLEAAQKEYQIAALIQKTFRSSLGKKANCPQPMDIHTITGILNENNAAVPLEDFFLDRATQEKEGVNFTLANFISIAEKLGIDPFYPTSEEADEETRQDPYRWLFHQCLEREKQGVYRYRVEGPNTRLRDLMTLELADRRSAFVNAHGAVDISDAAESFSTRLGEFYGVLHKNSIGYHFGFSEHCTLIDTTVAGMVMDIGGLTQNHLVNPDSQAYLVQMIKTTNLIGYLCKYILRTNEDVSSRSLDVFWEKYKGLYSNDMVEDFSQSQGALFNPNKIRTEYFDSLAGDWITLASDLKDLSSVE